MPSRLAVSLADRHRPGLIATAHFDYEPGLTFKSLAALINSQFGAPGTVPSPKSFSGPPLTSALDVPFGTVKIAVLRPSFTGPGVIVCKKSFHDRDLDVPELELDLGVVAALQSATPDTYLKYSFAYELSEIFVHLPGKSGKSRLDVLPTTTVADVKKLIEEKEGGRLGGRRGRLNVLARFVPKVVQAALFLYPPLAAHARFALTRAPHQPPAGFPFAEQLLYHGHQLLADESATLEACGLEGKATLHLHSSETEFDLGVKTLTGKHINLKVGPC
jgi:hypothetical protein